MYIREADPENAVDYPSAEQMAERLSDEWSDDDTVEVQAIMADYLTGPQDDLARAKLCRQMIERAQKIMDRAVEAAIAKGAKP